MICFIETTWTERLTLSFPITVNPTCLEEPAKHNHCFQWGSVVYCHDCKKLVATSYVQKYFKKPYWLTDEQIKENESKA